MGVESLRSEDFREFVRVGAERWLELIQDWLQFSTDCHVILYEVNTHILLMDTPFDK